MKQSCFVLILAGVLRQACGKSALPSKLTEEIPDSFKLIETFTSLVSISNANNDTKFECLRAYRTSFNPDTHSADYTWMLQASGDPSAEALHFHAIAEDGGKLFLTLDDDPTVFVGTFLYTDYKNCAIEDLDFQGHQCILWSQAAVKDSVPPNCIDKFVKICGVEVPKHSRDLCPDGEGDY